MRNKVEKYFAELSIYANMAYFVAKVLHIRPNEILDEWCAPELIVTFGEYANEQTQQNYADWKNLDPKQRASIPKPPEYIVYFHGEND